MCTPKAVIFDLDDTLYPEREYAFSGFAAVAAAFRGILGDPEETIAEFRALFDTEHRLSVFDALLAERNLKEDRQLIARMIETYREHVPALSLYPDADAALTRLRGDFKLGVITDGRVITQSLKLAALKLGPRLDEIIITSELGPGFEKPHPLAFERMADNLGAEHAECVYVADNPAKDFIAPNKLGWITVQVIRPDGVYQGVPPAVGGRAIHVINTLDNLDAIVPA